MKTINAERAGLARLKPAVMTMVMTLALTVGTASAWAQDVIKSVAIDGQQLPYVRDSSKKNETADFGIYEYSGRQYGVETTHEVYGPIVYTAESGITFTFADGKNVNNVWRGGTQLQTGTDFVRSNNGREITVRKSYFEKSANKDSTVTLTFSDNPENVAMVLIVPAAKVVVDVRGKTSSDDITLMFNGGLDPKMSSTIPYDKFWGKNSNKPDRHIEFWEYGANGQNKMRVNVTPGSGRRAKLSYDVNGEIKEQKVQNAMEFWLTKAATYNVAVDFSLADSALADSVKSYLTDACFKGINLDSVTNDLTLKTIYPTGSLNGNDTIIWQSSDPNVVSVTGKVTQPEYLGKNREVSLTATILRDNEWIGFTTFTLTVLEKRNPKYASVDRVSDSLTWDAIKGLNIKSDSITSALLLPKTGRFVGIPYDSVKIAWTSKDPSVISVKAGPASSPVDTGVITRKAGADSGPVTLTAAIRLVNDTSINTTTTIGGLIVRQKETVQPNDIVFKDTSVVYNRNPQRGFRAGLMPAVAALYTSNNSDRFDTTYTYLMVEDADGHAVQGNPTAVAPTAAGKCSVTVTWSNRKYYGTKKAALVIQKKPLTASMLSVGTRTATYSGAPVRQEYSVVDGERLIFGTDFVGPADGEDGVYQDNKDAGTKTARVIVEGRGNYGGTAFGTFSIDRKTISIDSSTSTVPSREYNGLTTLSSDGVTVEFTGLIPGQTLAQGTDYTFAAINGNNTLAYNSPNVAQATSVTGTIRLLDTSSVARNYKLANAAGNNFSKSVGMDKKIADTSDFVYRIDTVLYTGVARRPISVAFKSGLTNPGGTLTVRYDGDTAVPVGVGSYSVTVDVSGGSNYEDYEDYDRVPLGFHRIDDPEKPQIKAQPTDTMARVGGTALFSVTAVSPNNGLLSYQWYRNDTLISGATGYSYSVPATAAMVGAYLRYHVVVTNTKTGEQVPDTIHSAKAKLEIKNAARSIAAAGVTVSDDKHVYDGTAKAPSNVTVKLGDIALQPRTDYTLSYSDSVNAGTVIVTVTGVDDYDGAAFGSFVIGKSKLTLADLSYVRTVQYTGGALPVEVTLTKDRAGLGTVSARYGNLASAPVNVGKYDVVVSVADNGRNFTGAADLKLGTYEIVKKQPVADDFIYAIPTDHRWTGAPQGIGGVAVKGTGYGKLEILYDTDATLPVEIGRYQVFASINGGDNYLPGLVRLGEYTISDTVTSVASAERVVPGGALERVAVVAPVGAASGEFTVGPNPVARAQSASGVTFFWRGKALVGGKLSVFDASGSLVARVSVVDKELGVDKRKVGAWNLTDASGRPVAAGAYLVKGALSARDGGKVKVSLVVGVRR